MAGEESTVQPGDFVFDALLYRTWAVRRHLVLSPIVITPADHLTGLFNEILEVTYWVLGLPTSALNWRTYHRREFAGDKKYSTHLARGDVVLVSYRFDG